MSTVKVTWFDRQGVEQALGDHVRRLTGRHPEIEEVILFGSLVSGTPVPGSDVDLLLVLSHSNRSFLDRIPAYLPTGFPVSVDVFPYTREELERMTADGNHLVLRALREGRTLFHRV